MSDVKQNSARDFFLHLLSIVTLYMSIVSLLIVLFQIIQYFVPDVLDASGYLIPQDAIRTPVAILFISFPVYAWSVWFLSKLTKQDPALADFKVRKWLMYLTVFVSALVMIITLISVVFNFLNGNLTLRFFLEVGSVLLVSAMAFYYYLVTVKQEGNGRLLRSIEVGSMVLVFGAIASSFFVMGSPFEQRARRIDMQRVSELQTIDMNAQDFFSSNDKTLPASLDTLYASYQNQALRPDHDPVTGEMYTYEVTGTTTYKLCATFTHKSYEWENAERHAVSDVSYPYYYGMYDWTHDAGYFCFERTIDPYRLEDVKPF